MTTTASVTIQNSTASISGTLDHKSVPQVLHELDEAEFSTVDLQQTVHSNSAGVAMLLELIELGKQRGVAVEVVK